jgi:fucose permease
MLNKTLSSRRLLLMTLSLTYIAFGMLGALPGASLIRLASNTHVSLETVSSMFTIGGFGGLLGTVLTGVLIRYSKPKYLLMLGLFSLGSGAILVSLTSSFLLLLIGQMLVGVAFGCIDISLNTIATLAFQDTLSQELNTIHAMFGLGALLGPLVLAFGLQFFNSLPLAYFIGGGIAAFTILSTSVQSIPELPHRGKDELQKEASAGSLRGIMGQGLLWLMVLQIGIYVAAEIGFSNWIVTAVSQQAAVSLALAAPVATAFFIGLTTGRLGGAQLLRRGWISETHLLYTALLGGTVCDIIVAMFSGQLLISYVASALVGCFYGPLFPGIMAVTSRRFVHAIGPASSMMMFGDGVAAMIAPTAMGLLIPVLGVKWVMAIPAFCCVLCLLAMMLTTRVRNARD